jgi:hypothetical protein
MPAKDAKASAALGTAAAGSPLSPRREAAASIVAAAALLVTCVLAVSARLASIIKYESVIHEFDPYFNYRKFCVGGMDGMCVGGGGRASFLLARVFFQWPSILTLLSLSLQKKTQASPNSWPTTTCTACGTGLTTGLGKGEREKRGRRVVGARAMTRKQCRSSCFFFFARPRTLFLTHKHSHSHSPAQVPARPCHRRHGLPGE